MTCIAWGMQDEIERLRVAIWRIEQLDALTGRQAVKALREVLPDLYLIPLDSQVDVSVTTEEKL